MSIVVPAFLLGAGIALGMAIQATVVGLARRVVPIHVAFGALCFSLCGVLFNTARLYSAASVEAATSALWWQDTFIAICFPLF